MESKPSRGLVRIIDRLRTCCCWDRATIKFYRRGEGVDSMVERGQDVESAFGSKKRAVASCFLVRKAIINHTQIPDKRLICCF